MRSLRRLIFFLIFLSLSSCFGKEVAITIDDGPSLNFLNKVFPVLKKYNARATFFVVGRYLESNPSLVNFILKNGHEIGNHTYSHRCLNFLSEEEIKKELEKTDSLIRKRGGKPIFFRPPYGKLTEEAKEIIKKLGYRISLWTIDPKDWQNPSPEFTTSYILERVREREIILLHERKNTWKALPKILEGLKKRGYVFFTLSEYYGLKPPEYIEGKRVAFKRDF